jgi:hypothetical protein
MELDAGPFDLVLGAWLLNYLYVCVVHGGNDINVAHNLSPAARPGTFHWRHTSGTTSRSKSRRDDPEQPGMLAATA